MPAEIEAVVERLDDGLPDHRIGMAVEACRELAEIIDVETRRSSRID